MSDDEGVVVVCLDATKRPHMPAMRTRCAECGRAVWMSHHARREVRKQHNVDPVPLCIRCVALSEDVPNPGWLDGQKEMVARMTGKSEEEVQELADFLTLMLQSGIDPENP